MIDVNTKNNQHVNCILESTIFEQNSDFIYTINKDYVYEAISYFLNNIKVFEAYAYQCKNIYIISCCHITLCYDHHDFSVFDLINLYQNSDFKFINKSGHLSYCFRIEVRHYLNVYQTAFCYSPKEKRFFSLCINQYENHLTKIRECLKNSALKPVTTPVSKKKFNKCLAILKQKIELANQSSKSKYLEKLIPI